MRSTVKPASSPAALVALRCASLKYAGTVITARVTSRSSARSASAFSFFKISAEICSGENSPARVRTFSRVPIRRLIDAIVFCGSSARIRLGARPTIASPFAGKCTTDGVSRSPSASASKSGKPASIAPMSEFVVPRSMPTMSDISIRRLRRFTRIQRKSAKISVIRRSHLQSHAVFHELPTPLAQKREHVMSHCKPFRDGFAILFPVDMRQIREQGVVRLGDKCQRGVELIENVEPLGGEMRAQQRRTDLRLAGDECVDRAPHRCDVHEQLDEILGHVLLGAERAGKLELDKMPQAQQRIAQRAICLVDEGKVRIGFRYIRMMLGGEFVEFFLQHFRIERRPAGNTKKMEVIGHFTLLKALFGTAKPLPTPSVMNSRQ